MIGQDAVNTANAFAEGVGFDGVVLTKLDGDARGGAALSIARVTGRPIMFASNGEALKDFDVFHPDRMASRILGMGDMLTLIEQAEKTFDAEESAKAAAKLTGQGGEFGLADFLKQMQMVRKMGPLSKIFGMLPGMGEIKDQIDNIDEREVDRIEAIIHSMTPSERDNPKIIDGSRRARIASGSGVEVSEVNGLVNRFFEARKMMTSMASGKMPGMPGLPGTGGGGARRPRPPKKKKGGRGVSGNPAKRNAPGVRSVPRWTRRPRSAAGELGRRGAWRRRWRTSSCRPSCATGSASSVAWLPGCTCTGWSFPRASSATSGWSTGVISPNPSATRRPCTGGWLLPGLVDAHCHVGLESARGGARRGGRAARADRAGRRGAAAARRRQPGGHPLDGRAGRPAPDHPGRPAHRPAEALPAQLRRRGRARRRWSPRSNARPPAATAGSSWWGTGSTGGSVT